MKPQAIIFDLDGVITDTAHLHFMAWKQIADEMGIVIDEAFNDSLKGISRMASLQRILQHGGKEGRLSESECQHWASRKKRNLCQFLTPVDAPFRFARDSGITQYADRVADPDSTRLGIA
ncbi:beta-phosphoglucomutase [Salmonella enterica subsp. indica]|uniref:Beta-phosphoglucomutase n=1 Tax=Salmonella enterica subsp. indica TaxID=59207 RepID=A0A379XPV4_SALER|nr:beta-phosphoglucomutase [Salmonella enterica subsp. indica]